MPGNSGSGDTRGERRDEAWSPADTEQLSLEARGFGCDRTARRRAAQKSANARTMRRQASRELMRRLKRDARRLCEVFSLRYRSLEAERAGVTSRFGACFSDGTIKIRLYHATTGRPLKYSSLVDTLCHELAHLRHFNHGPQFQRLYQQILECARREGIYRPAHRRSRPSWATGATGATPPRRAQLSLFG